MAEQPSINRADWEPDAVFTGIDLGNPYAPAGERAPQRVSIVQKLKNVVTGALNSMGLTHEGSEL